MSDTAYAKQLAYADINDCRIERIHVKELDQVEIRFSWWPEGKFVPRPLDLPENDLLDLIREAISEGVFTQPFIDGLRDMLNERPPAA